MHQKYEEDITHSSYKLDQICTV